MLPRSEYLFIPYFLLLNRPDGGVKSTLNISLLVKFRLPRNRVSLSGNVQDIFQLTKLY